MKHRKYLKETLMDASKFAVIAELTGGPGYNFSPIEKFIKAYQDDQGQSIPQGITFAGVSLPQNPGGVANIDPSDVIAVLQEKQLGADLDIIPHLSCKDANADSLMSTLVGFRQRGILTTLVLTGDKPASAQGVFDVESVGLLAMIKRMNQAAILKAKPGQWDGIPQFFAGAAVSQFKYTEGLQMMQYYKMEKKITAGADYLVTQVGWDWKKSLELMQYLKDNQLDTPVFGNVYWLTTLNPAPRLMHDIKLPGCYVSTELLNKLKSETVEEHMERAAQQVAMYKAMGYAGVDLGGVHDYDVFVKILKRAVEIGENWEQFKDNLYWPPKETFYLYDDSGKQVELSHPKKNFHEKFYGFMHRAMLDPDHRGFHCFKKTLKLVGADNEDNFTYKAFNSVEKLSKYWIFECEECGDCFLPENFGYCSQGPCEKGISNAPCGDGTVDGFCGNNLELRCVGEKIYNAASAEAGGREKLRKTINKPRNPALRHTSSLVNYLFGKDHTKKSPLICIGESIHASVPKINSIMAELHDLGADAYTRPSGPLSYIRALIEGQADDGASYILVNLDAFGKDNPQKTIDMMLEYVRLVRKWGNGVPICIDSSNDDVLIAGLKEWYNTTEDVNPPLLSSIKLETADKIMPLKKDHDFAFVGLLASDAQSNGSVQKLYSQARQIFDKAMQYDFKPAEIFFEAPVLPIAGDTPAESGTSGYTYRLFEAIKKIKTDSQMKKCHFSLSITNSAQKLPGRKLGICRAYVAKAMECGLDAAVVNTAHQYGLKDPAPDLLKLVDAYASQDGSPGKQEEARTLMDQFCTSTQKPR